MRTKDIKYEATHRDELLDRKRKYYYSHRDELSRKKRENYEQNKDEINKKRRAARKYGDRGPKTVLVTAPDVADPWQISYEEYRLYKKAYLAMPGVKVIIPVGDSRKR